MKLTNYMRDAFVSAAMQDVPHTAYEEQAESFGHKSVNALFAKTFPGVDKNNPDVEDWLNQRGVNMPKGLGDLYTYAPSYDCLASQPDVWAELCRLGEKQIAQNEVRHALEVKLRAVARSCNTRKQLVEALPEMEKYLPEDEPAAMRTLPVVANVIADFVNAGWPKA